MQDRYTGDIGDYGKLGLLRCLAASGLRIGVNWYRTPDEDHNEDGRFIGYAHDPRYRECDAPLWEAMAQLLDAKQRRVEALEENGILDAVFFHDILDFRKLSSAERLSVRAAWHCRALTVLKKCDLVFVDPDNGLMVPSARRSKKGSKYVLPDELFDYYRQGASVIYYQHKARRPDAFYIAQHRALLQNPQIQDAQGLGLKFTRTSLRYYWFLVHPKHVQAVQRCIETFLSGPWHAYFQLF